MKLNIANPSSGAQKVFEIDDEKKLRAFYDKRMSQEVEASHLGDEWKGYIVRVSGGNDKQGFPMKQGVLTNGRVRLLMKAGHSCYRPRRTGERRRKSVRGCIVDANLAVLNLVIVKKGDKDIPGLTDTVVPRRLGPKRASKIRKLFNLTKDDDVRQYVIRRPLAAKEGSGKKSKTKAPKIQRLITPVVLQRKRHRLALKRKRVVKRREDAATYHKLLAQRLKEKQAEKLARRRSSASRTQSQSQSAGHSVSSEAAPQKAAPAAKPAKPVAKPVAKPAAAPQKPKATGAAAPAKAEAKAKPAAAAKPAAPAKGQAAAKPAAAAKPKAAPKK